MRSQPSPRVQAKCNQLFMADLLALFGAIAGPAWNGCGTSCAFYGIWYTHFVYVNSWGRIWDLASGSWLLSYCRVLTLGSSSRNGATAPATQSPSTSSTWFMPALGKRCFVSWTRINTSLFLWLHKVRTPKKDRHFFVYFKYFTSLSSINSS